MRINEIDADAYTAQTQKLADFIKTNCEPWLNTVGNAVFYRGTKTLGKQIDDYAYITDVREDRKPRDSSLAATEVFNDAIQKAGGVANRNNSVFITSEYDVAHSYVNNTKYVFVVLPIGEFNYTWSDELQDWFADAIQKAKILNYVDRKAAVDALKERYPYIFKISDYDFLHAPWAVYSHSKPVGTYYVTVRYTDNTGEDHEKSVPLPITHDMISISGFAKDIVTDVGIVEAANTDSEVMLRPKSGKLLLVDAIYYKNTLRHYL